jgi:O-antigen ligase
MFVSLFKNLQRNYFKDPLKFLELTFLSLMLLSLPTLEAPKNVFLVFFLIVSFSRQIQMPIKPFNSWDFIFLIYIASAFLTALFAGISEGSEWKGFKGIFLWILIGWLIMRANYSRKILSFIFIVTLIATIPALLWGGIQYLILHTKDSLELHSVGHVNHSAIYLCMNLGSSFGLMLALWKKVDSRKALLLAGLTSLLFSGLVVGESRGALAVGFILITSLALILPNPSSVKASLAAMIIGTLLFIFLFNAPVIQKHFKSLEADSVYLKDNEKYLGERLLVWNVSFEAMQFYPLFGVGNGNWHLIKISDIQKAVEIRGDHFEKEKYMLKANHSHSLYLTAATERGLFGCIALLMLLVLWLKTLIKSFRYMITDSAKGIYFWAGSFSAWITTFGIGIINSTFHHEHAILAMILLGIHLSYLKKNEW